ncbi:similar to An12g01780 [Aspergillus luchuensis IFO 4308]|nr:similar to An12g01780 [Aspergillus luchuensis IFO 4308]
MFAKIPSEILLHIIPFFTPPDYTRLVLVCNAWYTAFIPHLYHHVSLPLNEYDYLGAAYGIMPQSLLPVRRFTQVMITNPSLAPLIRSLELYPSDCKEGKWEQLPPLEILAEEKYRHFMLPYGQSKRKHRRKFYSWRRDLKQSSERTDFHRPLHHFEDAWLALLLVQLVNLEKLGVALPEEVWIGGYEDGPFPPRHSPHFERVIEWASKPELGILTKLRHISLTNGPCIWESELSVDAVPLTRLLPFLRIPSLRKLYVSNPCDRSQLSMPKDLPTVQITHLDFECPDTALPSLPHLLNRCSALESFTLQQQGWHEYESQYWQDLRQLYQSLQSSRFSLRHLSLTFNDWNVRQDAKTPTPVFFGSFSNFLRLETVCMRWGNLLQFTEDGSMKPVAPLWQVLPRSLSHLFIDHCLLQCSSALYTELKGLITHCPTHVPSLRKLYLRFASREQDPSTSADGVRAKILAPDPTTRDRLRALELDFEPLNVDFRIFQGDDIVPFGQEFYIRKKWPCGYLGQLSGL